MSNSNYSIGLQRLKPVHTAYGAVCMPIRKLLMHWSWARDVNGRDRDVDNFSPDETETRRWYVSRPSRDRDVETETTTSTLENQVPRTHNNIWPQKLDCCLSAAVEQSTALITT